MPASIICYQFIHIFIIYYVVPAAAACMGHPVAALMSGIIIHFASFFILFIII
jgi:hypothetical protein